MAPPEVKEAWTFNPANFEYIKDKFLIGNGIKSPIYSQRAYSRHSFDTLSSVSELKLSSVSSCGSLFLTGDHHKPISRLTFTESEMDLPVSGSNSEMSLLTWSENPYVTSSMGSSVSIYSAKPRNGLNYLPFGTQVKVMDKMWSKTKKLTIQEWIEALDSPPFSDVSSYHAESPSLSPTPEPKGANNFRFFFQDMLRKLTQKKTKVTEIEIIPCKSDDVISDDATSTSSGKSSKNFRSRVQKFFSRFVVCGRANQD